MLILYALGAQSSDETQPGLVVIAAVPVALGMLAVAVIWLTARRRFPSEANGTLLGSEGALSAVAVGAVLAPVVLFGLWAWNLVI